MTVSLTEYTVSFDPMNLSGQTASMTLDASKVNVLVPKYAQAAELVSKPAGGVVAFAAPKAVVLGPVMGVGPEGPASTVPGPKGDKGDPGPAGPAGSVTIPAIEFTFPVSSTTWYLPHDLGSSEVDVVTRDNNGDEIYGDVSFLSPTEAQVEWYYPTSGSCRVSL